MKWIIKNEMFVSYSKGKVRENSIEIYTIPIQQVALDCCCKLMLEHPDSLVLWPSKNWFECTTSSPIYTYHYDGPATTDELHVQQTSYNRPATTDHLRRTTYKGKLLRRARPLLRRARYTRPTREDQQTACSARWSLAVYREKNVLTWHIPHEKGSLCGFGRLWMTDYFVFLTRFIVRYEKALWKRTFR